MNLKKTLLFYCNKILEEYKFSPMIGGELEFYCDIPEKLKKYRPIHDAKIVEEDGDGQFEIKTQVYFDIIEFLKDIEDNKRHLLNFAKKEGIKIIFDAQPYKNMPGNGMHIHFNFIDDRRYNVFDLCKDKESNFLLYSVGGLLFFIKQSMIFFAPNKKCYARYKKSMFAPVKISWGNNNRTASLRIISRVNDIRRIEHRVPCADADPLSVVTAMIVAIYYGLDKKIVPKKKTYGNAFDAQYRLPYLPRSFDRAQKIFNNSEYKKLFLK